MFSHGSLAKTVVGLLSIRLKIKGGKTSEIIVLIYFEFTQLKYTNEFYGRSHTKRVKITPPPPQRRPEDPREPPRWEPL